MSFLKNVLKPFVDFSPEEENGKQLKKPQKPAQETTVNSARSYDSSIPETTPVSTTASTTRGDVDLKEYTKYFDDLVEEANTKNSLFQGTDFKEFIDSKADIDAIADEGTKYKTAFNVLKRTGLTKEKLITTGQQYIKLIEQDLQGFQNAYNEQYKAEIQQKEQLLQKKAEEVEALNNRLATLNEEMKQLSQQVVQNKQKLDTNKNAFLAAGQQKKQEIESELQKISEYF
jgi:chromosome segregation ATPase